MKQELLNGPKSLDLYESPSDYNSSTVELTLFNEGIRIKNKAWLSQKNQQGSTADFVRIDPTATFYYDIVYSNQTPGNLFYIGFERYDEDMTETNDNSTIYVVQRSTIADNIRVTGTVDLSTNLTGNPTKYIRLKILNNWDNSTATEGILEIKGLSLIQKYNTDNAKIEKTHIVSADYFKENNLNEAKIFKYEGIESNCFYEI